MSAITSNSSGDWATGGTWVGGIAPVSGDTATIAAGHAITVSTTVTVGTSGATGTAAVAMSGAGGSLTIQAAGVFNLRGDLNISTNADLTINGTFHFDPPVGSQYQINYTGGASAKTITIAGTSTSAQAVVDTTVRGGSNGYINVGNTSGIGANVVISFAKFNKLGDTSNPAFGQIMGSFGATSLTVSNLLMISCGQFKTNCTGLGTGTQTIDKLDIRTPLTFQGSDCLTIQNDTSKTGGARSVTNTTIWQARATGTANVVIRAKDFTFGSTGVPGIVGYNFTVTGPTSSSVNGVMKNFIMAIDDPNLATTPPGAGQFLALCNRSNHVWTDSVFYSHTDNPHTFAELPTSATLAANQYNQNVFDGDGLFVTDIGECFVPNAGPTTFNQNICINLCGSGYSTITAGAQASCSRNTLFNTQGFSMGESIGDAANLTLCRNNLFVKPDSHGPYGLHQNSVGFVRQSTTTNPNYNAFWQMPGSTDPGAPAAPSSLNFLHPTLAVVSYLGPPQKALTNLAGKVATAGTTATNIQCTGAGFIANAVQVGDYVMKGTAGGGTTYSRVTAVVDASNLTVTTGSGISSGDTFDVRTSYWSTAGAAYGDAGLGDHDIHTNPNFIDSTRTIATWDTANGGAGTIANVGLEIVKLNGWDSTGAATTFNTNYGVANALSYIRTGFTPQNKNLQAAGSPTDGSPDIGALPIQPAGGNHYRRSKGLHKARRRLVYNG